MLPWIIGGLFAVIGLPMVFIARRYLALDRAIAGWPRAAGTVTSSHVEAELRRYRDQKGYSQEYTHYTPRLRYSYSVGGQELEGTEVTRTGIGSDWAKACIERYPVGQQVMVLYDPYDSKTAYLEAKRSTGAVILFSMGAFLVLLGLGVVSLSFFL